MGGREAAGRAVGPEASGTLVGVSEEELGGLCAGVGRGCRAQPPGHQGDAGASLSSPARVLLPHYFG